MNLKVNLTIEIEKKCHPRDHKFSQKMRKILPLHGNFSNISNTSSQLVDKHCRMFNSNMTGLTCGAETADLSEVHTGFSGVRVNRSLVLCVCVVDYCLSFGPYSFGHCIVCPSSFGHCIVCPSSFGHCIVCPSSFGHCVVCPSMIYGF